MGILRSDRSKSTPFRTTPDIKMKWALAVCFLIAAVRAETYEETDIAEDGEARLVYITVGSDGSTSITFNATSIQNAVILVCLSLSWAPLSSLSSGFPWAPCSATTPAPTLVMVMDTSSHRPDTNNRHRDTDRRSPKGQ